MALSAFDDKSQEPPEEDLFGVLAGTSDLWNQLIAETESRFSPLAKDWTYSGKKWGWALRLKQKKRAVLYMTPCEGFFLVGFALGQKAVDAAHASDLEQSVLDIIESALKFAEGRAVRLEIRSSVDVEVAIRLAEIKMSN